MLIILGVREIVLTIRWESVILIRVEYMLPNDEREQDRLGKWQTTFQSVV